MYNIDKIDIHGLDVSTAKHKLENYLLNISPNIKEVVVIHGYRNGDNLRKMVRYSLKSPKIERKIVSMNKGETILIIKQ